MGDILFLSGQDIRALMAPRDYLAAVEAGFRAERAGAAQAPPPMTLKVAERGGFHAKAACFTHKDRVFAAIKINGNFPANPLRFDLPTIQGVLFLADAVNGAPLVIMDSIEVTLRRTAAASALAAKHLARPDSDVLAICGCGAQARAHVAALADVLPLTNGAVWDIDPAKAESFAADMSAAYGLTLNAVANHRTATLEADVIVTCTTATAPFLNKEDVSRGAFIAAVGADHPYKSEITPDLMADARVVCDVVGQCAVMGDLRAAIAAGVMGEDEVVSELGSIICGAKQGRLRGDDVVVFDSTGTAIEDVAAAAFIYERARDAKIGERFSLA